jgi:ubiquinone/menaquinone biosynthesis C-methylase UbiE
MTDEAGLPAVPHDYILGHSDREIDRLKQQAVLIEPVTRRFFAAAGIETGMRVLDVGSGVGDVAFLAASMVGKGGEVVGADRSAPTLRTARDRAVEAGLRNVRFVDGDPSGLDFDGRFDAVLGRYVLQFQKDPGRMLRDLARHVRPGGVIVFHEIDWGGLESFPPVPTFDRCCRWGVETLRRHGTETRMGVKLYRAFVDGGLPPPTLRLEALIEGPAHNGGILNLMSRLMRTLLPQMEQYGVASAEDLDLRTLVERMSREASATGSIVRGHAQVGAWCRA